MRRPVQRWGSRAVFKGSCAARAGPAGRHTPLLPAPLHRVRRLRRVPLRPAPLLATPVPRCPSWPPPVSAPPPGRPAEQSEVWIVEDGEVHPWDGDFEDYKDELIREIAAELDEQEAEEARRQAERDEKRRLAGKK